jgi:hypothetical protein
MPRDERKRQQKLLKRRQTHNAKAKRARVQHSFGNEAVARRIIRNAREYPLHECLINLEWQDVAMASILISRIQPNDNIVWAVVNVDVYCLGVKQAYFDADASLFSYQKEIRAKYVSNFKAVACSAQLASQIIYGAIDYAGKLGFRPNPDFRFAQFMFEERSAVSANEELVFGKDGTPLYIQGPHDRVQEILARLDKAVGRDNYHYILRVAGPDDFDEEGETFSDFQVYEDDDQR